MAKGMAAKMPLMALGLNSEDPAQPLTAKRANEKPGATTPMKTSSSTIASRVTTSSKVAAMLTPTMFRPMKTT